MCHAQETRQIDGPTDPRELEAFFDPFFTAQIETGRLPGAVLVLVKDGRIFFSKGYGYADLAEQIPVIPDQTVFRVGSLSKLFTATAVMQLVERGLLSLDADVQTYLPFPQLRAQLQAQLHDGPLTPVTLAHLLTHTAGFDERTIGIATRDHAAALPLREYLAAHLPPRVFPPGAVASYSNHGLALAGAIVEGVSGTPFAQYIDEHILTPLEMRHSSFVLPSLSAAPVAVGYLISHPNYPIRSSRSFFQPVPVDSLQHIGPAVTLSATATDIAQFMIAHLQDGRYKDTRILQADTAQEMNRQHFTHHPRLPGYAYGFYEHFENNLRAILHDGGVTGFGSQLILLPEQQLGIFLSVNTTYPLPFFETLRKQFLDRYYPVAENSTAPPPRPDASSRGEDYAGSYRPNRYARRTLEKASSLFTHVQVIANEDGTLTIYSPDRSQEPTHWAEIAPLLFQRVGEDTLIAFQEDVSGHIVRMFIGTNAFDKLAWYETVAFQWNFMGVAMLVFLTGSLWWPVGSMIRQVLHRSPPRPPVARRARFLAGVVCVLALGSLLLTLPVLQGGPLADWLGIQKLLYGLPTPAYLLLWINVLTTVLTPGLVVCTYLAWKRYYWTFLGRCLYTLVTLVAVLYIPFLVYWNQLGFYY